MFTDARENGRLGAVEVRFEDADLEEVEIDPTATAGHPPAIVKAFRKRIQFIRAAEDERAFYALKSLHYEKLKGDREGQRSMKLNDRWRLILRIEDSEKGKAVVVVEIADYH